MKKSIGINQTLFGESDKIRPLLKHGITARCSNITICLQCLLKPSQWRHNGRDSVSNHQLHKCYLNYLFSADERKHQISESLAFVWGIHRWPVSSPHKWPVTRKTFPFDDVIMSDDAGKAVAICEHSVEFDCTLDLKLKYLLPMRPKFYT